tara:strand:- start:656 stop:763 length:108 start_codon:yes stop_codon:yes gene_type:complete
LLLAELVVVEPELEVVVEVVIYVQKLMSVDQPHIN